MAQSIATQRAGKLTEDIAAQRRLESRAKQVADSVFDDDTFSSLDAPEAGAIQKCVSVRAAKGGLFKEVRSANTGGEVHHMPADSSSPLSTNNGPAILMDADDHKLTASCDHLPALRAKMSETLLVA